MHSEGLEMRRRGESAWSRVIINTFTHIILVQFFKFFIVWEFNIAFINLKLDPQKYEHQEKSDKVYFVKHEIFSLSLNFLI